MPGKPNRWLGEMHVQAKTSPEDGYGAIALRMGAAGFRGSQSILAYPMAFSHAPHCSDRTAGRWLLTLVCRLKKQGQAAQRHAPLRTAQRGFRSHSLPPSRCYPAIGVRRCAAHRRAPRHAH